MNHAITLRDDLLTLGIGGGFIAAGFGLLMMFAGGMSDAPSDGDRTSGIGCTVAACGLALFVGCIAAAVL